MRLVLDLQGAQGENRARGIGRYSLSLAEALIRNAGSHEVIAVVNGRLGEADPAFRDRLARHLPDSAIRAWTPPPGIAAIQGDDWRRRAAESLRETFIDSMAPDIVHLSSLFEGLVQDGATSLGASGPGSNAVTLYDLIPLLHPETYLTPNPLVRRWYLNKLDHLRRADLCLAISRSSRQEAIEHLGMAQDQVVSIGAAIDESFRRLDLPHEEGVALREHLGLRGRFVLYTGGIDPRKNIEGLIRAFAALPMEVRARHQLAIVCSVQESDRERLMALAREAGLPQGGLVLTGYVSDEDLVKLYNLCTLFVFPSWHEGFGLPALEAMACGAPAIAADSSSLPEVMGRTDTLFAARDDAAMTAMMHRVLTDDDFRLDLRRFGPQQAKNFSWDKSARLAWDAFDHLHAERRARTTIPVSAAPAQRPRLAYVSPLPPTRSGVADYSAELLPELAKHYRIDVILDRTSTDDPWVQANCGIRDAAWFDDNAERYDRVLYHFGNSEFHHHMFDLLERHPGVVMLHDFFLSGIIAHREWHMGVPGVWSEALYRSHGYPALKDRFTRQDDAGVIFHYPCSLDVLRHARGVIVHSEYSRRLTRDWFGWERAADLSLIPHLRVPAGEIDRAAARHALGLADEDFLVCSFGLLGPIKLNDRLLKAWLGSSLAANASCRLVFVGENAQGPYGDRLADQVAAEGKGRISITGFASPELYRTYLAAADLAVQLRTKSRGETSGTVLDCMNYGIATIVNAQGTMADLPSDGVRILPDLFEDAALTAALEEFHRRPKQRQALGTRAREIIRHDHAPRRIAEQYAEAIERAYVRRGVAELVSEAAADADAPAPDAPGWSALAEALARTFPPVSSDRQLLVDVSELARHDAGSGIQRVVRNILTQWLAEPPAGFRIEPVYATQQEGYRYARRFTLGLLGCPPGVLEDDPVEFAPGDFFLGLDLQPHVVVAQRDFYQRLRLNGVKVGFVVYDLLCIERPDCFLPGAAEDFTRWLEVITAADSAHCISAAAAESLRRWLAAHHPERLDRYSIQYFHLGADFHDGNGEAALPESWNRRQPGPAVLMVGSIEPRKGYAETLAAADAMWARGVNFTLAIVGKAGWMVETLVAALRSHPERERRLFWFERLDDATLGRLFQAADGLLMASEGEGFGLPLVEAAHFGRPVLARDLPVFREIAGDHARYFSGDLAEALTSWLRELAEGMAPASEGIEILTWRESADQLAAGLPRREPPPVIEPEIAIEEPPEMAAPETAAPAPAPDPVPPQPASFTDSQSPLQFYPGYTAEDVALLKRYATAPAGVFEDHFVDGFGTLTPIAHVPFATVFNPGRLQLPVPDDGYHAETIEYVATVDSIDRAGDAYVLVEIGAAWGPWISLGGALARRVGKREIALVGVEADPQRFRLVTRQMIANRLRPADPSDQEPTQDWTSLDGVRSRLIQGAAGAEEGILWFPKNDIADLGTAALADVSGTDHRGREVEVYEVKAHTLAAILSGLERVDLLHVDIQGSEYELLSVNVDLLEEKVAAMLIGTHSRAIEGKLIELLIGRGWSLHREKPCRVDWTLQTPDLTGRTLDDGCQYWRSPNA